MYNFCVNMFSFLLEIPRSGIVEPPQLRNYQIVFHFKFIPTVDECSILSISSLILITCLYYSSYPSGFDLCFSFTFVLALWCSM